MCNGPLRWAGDQCTCPAPLLLPKKVVKCIPDPWQLTRAFHTHTHSHTHTLWTQCVARSQDTCIAGNHVRQALRHVVRSLHYFGTRQHETKAFSCWGTSGRPFPQVRGQHTLTSLSVRCPLLRCGASPARLQSVTDKTLGNRA